MNDQIRLAIDDASFCTSALAFILLCLSPLYALPICNASACELEPRDREVSSHRARAVHMYMFET